jgi:hypothetical protein
MCKKLTYLIASALLLGFSVTAQATDYYVSPDGNDNNSGTSTSQAWQTIEKVNSTVFAPGDSILFEGGRTFAGSLYFNAADAGTPANPVKISSYGIGRATISSGTLSYGLHAYNCAGLLITDLIFVGAGPLVSGSGYGLMFKTELSSGQLEYIHIDNLDVSGYRNRGIAVAGPNGAVYKDFQLTNTDLHDNGVYGMASWGTWPPQGYLHQDFYIADCKFYNNRGVPGVSPHSGSGIELDSVNGAIIEYCEAYNNGELCNAEGGGPFGIWAWNSSNVVIQFCESYLNKTSAGDGGGFDLDGGATSCVMQYNYSHDNYGAGYGVFQIKQVPAHTNNVIRYNISENDSLFNKHGAVYFWADNGTTISNMDVHNNTLYKPAKPLQQHNFQHL